MALLTVINACCGLRLRRDGCTGPLVLAGPDDTSCCCKTCECVDGVLISGDTFYDQVLTYTYLESTGNLGPYCSFTYIRGEQTITIPNQVPVPVVVVLTGSVNDDLLVNGEVIDGVHPSPFGSCNGAHAVNVCFTANSRTFTLATKDNYGFGMDANITIKFCRG